MVVPGAGVGYKLLSIRMMRLGDSSFLPLAQVRKGWNVISKRFAPWEKKDGPGCGLQRFGGDAG